MAKQTNHLHYRESFTKEIQERRGILERAKVQLKQEFFGIDGVIDEIVESISSWYLFPDIQEKPVIVNLWGMTGVGKSSLISRLSELIAFSKRLFFFDLGETSNREWVIRQTLYDIFENENGFPIILCFDEFQHSRTKSSTGEDISRPDLRIIWSLLSEGKFQMSRYFMGSESLYQLTYELSKVLEQGVTVEHGMLTGGADIYHQFMDHHDDLTEKVKSLKGRIRGADMKQQKRAYQAAAIPFIPSDSFNIIFDAAHDRFKTRSELKNFQMSMNGQDTVDFLYELIELTKSRKTVDCTKALMFVVGNLDEAYTMNQNLNPDIDADAFYEGSLKITVPYVKSALRRSYRSEQIARLGNTHILYPALNQKAYQKIIRKALDGLKNKISKRFGIHLEFEESVHNLIYREGVYPTQGARPLFTTIHFLIEAKLGKIIGEGLILSQKVKTIRIESIGTFLHIFYYNADRTLIQEFKETLRLSLDTIRKPKQDDNQAITAVHESGHAILSALLLHAIPELVISVSADAGSTGFTHVKVVREYQSKCEVIPKIASQLGGFVAEKLIFGTEFNTMGSERDIREATELACETVKASGMGSIRGSIQVASMSTNDQLHVDVNEEISRLLESGERLAEKTLQEERVLLIRIADYLSDHRSMDRPQLEEYISTYAVTKSLSAIRNTFSLAYRNVLKELAQQVSTKPNKILSPALENISLNKTNP